MPAKRMQWTSMMVAGAAMVLGLSVGCGSATSGTSGGGNNGGGNDVGASADAGTTNDVGTHADTGTQGSACSSGQHWTMGNEGSALMDPGGNCVSCHANSGEAPMYATGATVFGDYRDEDNCYGVSGVTVELTGANGNVLTMTTNQAGNFFSASDNGLATPYTAKLTYQGRERPMITPQTDFNCANCHTAQGANAAPGRIVVP